MKKLLFLMVCFMSCTTAMAQTAIHGRVLDEGTNEPLIGATVVEQNTSNGTVTDVDGAFRGSVVKPSCTPLPSCT